MYLNNFEIILLAFLTNSACFGRFASHYKNLPLGPSLVSLNFQSMCSSCHSPFCAASWAAETFLLIGNVLASGLFRKSSICDSLHQPKQHFFQWFWAAYFSSNHSCGPSSLPSFAFLFAWIVETLALRISSKTVLPLTIKFQSFLEHLDVLLESFLLSFICQMVSHICLDQTKEQWQMISLIVYCKRHVASFEGDFVSTSSTLLELRPCSMLPSISVIPARISSPQAV